jgi:hypothetical protein
MRADHRRCQAEKPLIVLSRFPEPALNWIRTHKTLRVTPAMAAGISETVMDWSDIVEMMDADQPAKKRGPYKKPTDEISN